MALFPRNARTGQSYKKFGRKYIYSETTEAWQPVVSLASVSEARATAAASVGSTTVYALASELPLSNNTTGELAFVQETDRLYIWSGTGWYNIATITGAGASISGANPTYVLATDGTPVTITLTQSGLTSPTWSYEVTTGSINRTATVTQSDNVFTITPSTNASHNGTFGITFTATDGSNTIVESSSFSLEIILAWSKAATNYGYVGGGHAFNPAAVIRSTIDRFPFSSDTVSTGVASLTEPVDLSHPQSSSVAGYASGGSSPNPTPSYVYKNTIQKFLFSSEGATTLVGALLGRRSQASGSSSSTHGYSNGGFTNVPSNRLEDAIYKFSFASDGTTTMSGRLANATGWRHQGTTSPDDYSYLFGGNTAQGTNSNVVSKYPFAVDANASTIGNLTTTTSAYQCGLTTQDNAYLASGAQPGLTAIVTKWIYASDTAAGEVGSLTNIKWQTAVVGVSGADVGYIPGGGQTVPVASRVEKFTFASETGSGDFGSLSADTLYPHTNQY